MHCNPASSISSDGSNHCSSADIGMPFPLHGAFDKDADNMVGKIFLKKLQETLSV
jgi:hypothetical protein